MPEKEIAKQALENAWILKQIWLNIWLLFTGAVGGLISVIKQHKNWNKLSFWGKFTTILTWWVVANYWTPLVLSFVKLDWENGAYWIAFVLWYLGLVWMEKILEKIKL